MDTKEFQLPDDFPREGHFSSIAGTQVKYVARNINGRFVIGWTAEELSERHGCCESLAQQLVIYATQKSRENPDWTNAFIFERTSQAVVEKVQRKEWDLTPEERDWMMSRVKLLLNW